MYLLLLIQTSIPLQSKLSVFVYLSSLFEAGVGDVFARSSSKKYQGIEKAFQTKKGRSKSEKQVIKIRILNFLNILIPTIVLYSKIGKSLVLSDSCTSTNQIIDIRIPVAPVNGDITVDLIGWISIG